MFDKLYWNKSEFHKEGGTAIVEFGNDGTGSRLLFLDEVLQSSTSDEAE